MDIQFEAKISAKDLYRFNMRNAYTSMQGILSIICAALVAFVFIWKFDKLSGPYLVLFVILFLLFLVYVPASLWMKSKQIVKKSDVFKEPLGYSFGEEGILITSSTVPDDENVMLPWEDIFKVIKNKNYILIYTNRISAYIIPREQIADKEEEISEALISKVEDFKLKGFNR